MGDATLNGRELAVAAYLSEHVVPLLIGRDARRIEDTWQYLYKGAYWRRGPVTMTAIARGRHGALGHQGQVAGCAGLPAARRRGPVMPSWCTATRTARASTTRPQRWQGSSRPATGGSGAERHPRSVEHVRCAKGAVPYEPAERGAAVRDAWSSERYLAFVPSLFNACGSNSAPTCTCCMMRITG